MGKFTTQTVDAVCDWYRPGYNWTIFLDELARLERAALGNRIYGKNGSSAGRAER